MAVRSRAVWRDTFVLTLIAAAAPGMVWLCTEATAADSSGEQSGFVLLTGHGAHEHWLGYGMDETKGSWPPNWEIVDGALHCKGGGTDLKTRDEYGDFDLRFEWKVAPGANSGVMYRVSQEADPAYYTGPEYQIFDNVGHADGAN